MCVLGGGADVHLPVNWSFIVAGIIYAIILCSTQNLQRSIGVNLSVTHSLYVCILQRNTKHTEANKGRLYWSALYRFVPVSHSLERRRIVVDLPECKLSKLVSVVLILPTVKTMWYITCRGWSWVLIHFGPYISISTDIMYVTCVLVVFFNCWTEEKLQC